MTAPSPPRRATPTAPPVPPRTLRHLRRARDLMDRDFAEPLTVAGVAAEAGFSPSYFTRSFTRVYGTSPVAYLALRRVERAKDLLRSANLTVTEVCLAVGFTSLGTFSTRFTEIVGVSPRAYRRRHAGRDRTAVVPGCYVLAWSRPRRPARAAAHTGPERAGSEKHDDGDLT